MKADHLNDRFYTDLSAEHEITSPVQKEDFSGKHPHKGSKKKHIEEKE